MLRLGLEKSWPLRQKPCLVQFVGNVSSSVVDSPRVRRLLQWPLPKSYTNYLGRRLFRLLLTLQGLAAFALITLGVILTKWRTAQSVTFPLIFREIRRSGLRLMPMFLFMSSALGLVVIGQAVTRL
jgi:hypothetical protein